eukprot:jgi/Picre1/29957/NNA_005334.t2
MESIYGLGIIETALMPSPWLQEAVARAGSDDVGARTRVFLKMENTQKTGSFKARGAAFKVLSLTPEERKNGVVISSTGNHALAVLNAIKEIRKMTGEHIPVEMYLPETISSRKLSKIEREAEACGGHITLLGQDCVESEIAARRAAEEAGKVYISPYNDVDVVAGQGTIAIEILMATDKLDVVFVPVGGGGLISGVASALKAQIEGAAAVTIASIIKMAPSLAGKHVVAVICGGNVGGDMLDVPTNCQRCTSHKG